MKIKLPIQTKSVVEGENGELELKIEKGEKEFDVDMTLLAQTRFETHFPTMAEHEDLLSYSQRICAIKDLRAEVILSKMKMLYCWFNTDLSYEDFVRLFDLTDKEYIDKLSTKIQKVFDLIFNGSAEKN